MSGCKPLQWKATLATTALLATIAPVVGAEEETIVEWHCVPAADARATALTQGSTTYYQVVYANQGYYIEEIWKETNGERGLQTSAGMSCIGRADAIVSSQCLGFCPVRL